MAKKTLTEQIQKQLEEASRELTAARASLIHWQQAVTNSETEVARLQGALDSLEGKPLLLRVKSSEITMPAQIYPGAIIPVLDGTLHVGGARTETIDGIEYAIEPGMYAAKNSRGDVVIIPIGTQPPEIQDLPNPTRKAFALPEADGFDSPESLI